MTSAATPAEPLWDEKTVRELRRSAYVFNDAQSAMIAKNASPANALEAAQRALGTTKVSFSHLRNGYPVYDAA